MSIGFVLLSVVSAMFVQESISKPNPPVFPATEHYPCACYLPPDSGFCSSNSEAPIQKQHIVPCLGSSETLSDDDKSDDQFDGTLITQYFFDTATEECYPFSTQNCGGNSNRFSTLADCKATCRLPSSIPKATKENKNEERSKENVGTMLADDAKYPSEEKVTYFALATSWLDKFYATVYKNVTH